MLVLSRKLSERVVITTPEGERIEVQVVAFGSDGRVKLGFSADRAVSINRKEIQDVIDREKGEG